MDDVSIPIATYHNIINVCSAKTQKGQDRYGKFVKLLAVAVFGLDALSSSCLVQTEGETLPILDPRKILAIKGIALPAIVFLLYGNSCQRVNNWGGAKTFSFILVCCFLIYKHTLKCYFFRILQVLPKAITADFQWSD